MPKISCIMTTYNSEKYLRIAIESILNQTFKDFEFIISEGGSTDNTKEIIKEYAKKDKRIIFIDNKENLSNCECLNQCLKAAKGEYIAIMESDDFSIPNRFELSYKYLSKNENIYVLYHNYESFYENNEIKKFNSSNNVSIFQKNVNESDGICGYIGWTVASLFRKDLINLIGNFEFKYVRDRNYSAKVFLGNITYLNISPILYLKRDNKNSLYYRKIFKVRNDRHQSLKYLLKSFKANIYTKFIVLLKSYLYLLFNLLVFFKNKFFS